MHGSKAHHLGKKPFRKRMVIFHHILFSPFAGRLSAFIFLSVDTLSSLPLLEPIPLLLPQADQEIGL
jgi:hypothetical protein